jgi:hypothetical protein
LFDKTTNFSPKLEEFREIVHKLAVERVGGVHRFGQTQPVQVIHLLTENSIEERVWETFSLKKALFTGLFDEAKDEISFEKLGRKSMMHVIKDVFSDRPGIRAPDEMIRGIVEMFRKMPPTVRLILGIAVAALILHPGSRAKIAEMGKDYLGAPAGNQTSACIYYGGHKPPYLISSPADLS